MIDIHTHILPGIDDGSRDIRESAALLRAEFEQGVSMVVATPHFYAQEMSVNGFLEKRQRAYESLIQSLEEGETAQKPEDSQTAIETEEAQDSEGSQTAKKAEAAQDPEGPQTAKETGSGRGSENRPGPELANQQGSEDKRDTSAIPGFPQILLGAEVYFFPGMGSAAHLPQLTFEGTRVLLLEMPFAQWTGSIYKEVRQIIEEQELTVVLAHLERFYQYQKNMSVMEDILDLPVFVQVNTGALLDWKRRRLARKILNGSKPAVLGSDCHNMRSRRPNLAEGREVISRKSGGTQLLEQLDENARRLLG